MPPVVKTPKKTGRMTQARAVGAKARKVTRALGKARKRVTKPVKPFKYHL